VLDFGLAKALDPAGSASGSPATSPTLVNSPTLTLAGTQAGVILGTAAYMAPEQAAGGTVDRRADVWAFGVVLYEMLTGRRLFEGETVSHVLAGVLKDQPEWSSLPADLPAGVRTLLERCLRKDRKQRLQSIGDARVLLEEWRADSEASTPALTATPPAGTVAGASRSRWLAAAGIALVALAAGLAAGRWSLAPRPPARPQLRFPVALPASYSLAVGDEISVALSSDGKRQAVTAVDDQGARQLLVRDADQLEWRPLTGSAGASDPFFSPDGDWLGFFADGQLVKMAVAGGPAVRLAAASPQVRGATWSRDGYVYFAPDTAGPLLRVSENGGEGQPVTTLDGARSERTHRWPAALPDGGAVLFTCDTNESTEFYDDARNEAVRPATGERKVVLEGASAARYLAGGYLVFARGGVLFAQPFDERTLAVRGAPVPVAQEIVTDVASGAVQFALSDAGDALWVPGSTIAAVVQPAWLDRTGSSTPAEIQPGPHTQVALSRDGRRAVLATAGARTADLWVADLARGTLSRLTFEGSAVDPTWSPDGRRIAYDVASQGPGTTGADLRWKAADGSSDAEDLLADEAGNFAGEFSPDGSALACERIEAKSTQTDIWIVPLTGERKPWPFLATPAVEYQPEIAPGERWLAYVSEESGNAEVYVRPYPSGGGKWQISVAGGMEPHWSHDGRELFYRSRGDLMAVEIAPGAAFDASRPRRLFSGLRQGGVPHTYSVAPDGKRFLVLPAQSSLSRIDRVALLLGWGDSVRRQLAPRP